MKCAVLFFFVACAFVAQGNARSVDLSDRGVIADAMRAKLLASKQKMNKLVDHASVKVKQVIQEIQQKVDQLVDQLNVKAHQVNDKVFVKAEKFITKVEQIEDKYASYLSLGLDETEALEDVLPSAEPLTVEEVVPSVEEVVPSVEEVVPSIKDVDLPVHTESAQ